MNNTKHGKHTQSVILKLREQGKSYSEIARTFENYFQKRYTRQMIAGIIWRMRQRGVIVP